MDRFTGNMNLNAGRSAIFPRGSSDDEDAEIFDQVRRVEYEMLRVWLDGSTFVPLQYCSLSTPYYTVELPILCIYYVGKGVTFVVVSMPYIL